MSGCRKLSPDEVLTISQNFTGDMKLRDRAWFHFGIETGFRISEILSLKRKDFINNSLEIKTKITVLKDNMKGNNSSRSRIISPTMKKVIKKWLIEQQEMGYAHKDYHVFTARNGKVISRWQAWNIIKTICSTNNILNECVATHSMRKTFCDTVFNEYAKTKPIDAIALTQKAMGHARYDTTLLYRESIYEYENQQGIVSNSEDIFFPERQ